MVEDQKLTDHFSLYELTVTNRSEFQERNRDVSPIQISKLTALAHLLEHVRAERQTKIVVHSGYRCTDLNAAVGSTPRSQHLLCEAADFVPEGQDLGECFRALWRMIKDGKMNVGQLIHETADRYDGPTSWIHISLGTPYRDAARCGQILRMEHGKYQVLD